MYASCHHPFCSLNSNLLLFIFGFWFGVMLLALYSGIIPDWAGGVQGGIKMDVEDPTWVDDRWALIWPCAR